MRGILLPKANLPRIFGRLIVAFAPVCLLLILFQFALPVIAAPSDSSTYFDSRRHSHEDEGNDVEEMGGSPSLAATASLSPDPSTVSFQPNGQWHRFTVNSSGTVRVYTNPDTTPLNVEVYTSNAGNHCNNGAEREYKSRSNGQYIYLAGCQSGTGTVQLQTSSGTVIRTYTFTIGSSATPTPTATATSISTSTPTNTPTTTVAATSTPTPGNNPTASLSPDPFDRKLPAQR